MREEKEMIYTKFGNAKINNGYYRISSGKEGYHGKLLHRLIYEEYYGEIPDGYVIHHKNKVKTDNRIENLELIEVSKHSSLHNKGENHPFFGKKLPEQSERMKGENNPNYGKPLSDVHKKKISERLNGKKHTDETKKKISKAKNTTGHYRVSKHKDKNYKQGFTWRYSYSENGKRYSITRTNLDDLEKEVKSRGLEWEKI